MRRAGLHEFDLAALAQAAVDDPHKDDDAEIRVVPAVDQQGLERRIAVAVPLLSHAAGAEVVAVVGAGEPFVAVRDALAVMGFDEVIVSMLPPSASRWMRLELPRRIRALGVPVIEVVGAEDPAPPLTAA